MSKGSLISSPFIHLAFITPIMVPITLLLSSLSLFNFTFTLFHSVLHCCIASAHSHIHISMLHCLSLLHLWLLLLHCIPHCCTIAALAVSAPYPCCTAYVELTLWNGYTILLLRHIALFHCIIAAHYWCCTTSACRQYVATLHESCQSRQDFVTYLLYVLLYPLLVNESFYPGPFSIPKLIHPTCPAISAI